MVGEHLYRCEQVGLYTLTIERGHHCDQW